jgi:hypothetical protein
MASSLASGRVPLGAAAVTNAGLLVSGGLVAVEADMADAGLRVHYDKLTLLLDSGLPMGGNCKVSYEGLGAVNSVNAYCQRVTMNDAHVTRAAPVS